MPLIGNLFKQKRVNYLNVKLGYHVFKADAP
nr:MAG TPA: hypothetical protein [Bacteriophage sp.]